MQSQACISFPSLKFKHSEMNLKPGTAMGLFQVTNHSQTSQIWFANANTHVLTYLCIIEIE